MLPSYVKRVIRIALIAAAVFGLLAGIARGYVVAMHEMPARRALQSLEFVLDVEIGEADGPAPVVSAKLDSVRHLAAAHEQLRKTLQQVGGAGDWRLEIRDNRNQYLTDAYYELRPYVLEAVKRGNHTEMIGAFRRVSEELALDPISTFTVADGYAFVQLHSGTHYLYAVEHIHGQVGP